MPSSPTRQVDIIPVAGNGGRPGRAAKAFSVAWWLGLTAMVALLGGCTGFTQRLAGTVPRTGSLVPNSTLQLTPSFGLSLEKLAYVGAYAGIAYLVLDPLAPNWEIQEVKLPNDEYDLSLKMKRYHAGGAGEAREVFRRRARQLMIAGGFDSYKVLDYSEGLNSSMIGSQRVAEGLIRLVRDKSSAQGSAPPARNITANTVNPRS